MNSRLVTEQANLSGRSGGATTLPRLAEILASLATDALHIAYPAPPRLRRAARFSLVGTAGPQREEGVGGEGQGDGAPVSQSADDRLRGASRQKSLKGPHNTTFKMLYLI